MSYKGYDKWECSIPEIIVHSSNLKDFKKEILAQLKKAYINQATGVWGQIEYEITKIQIRKKSHEQEVKNV